MPLTFTADLQTNLIQPDVQSRRQLAPGLAIHPSPIHGQGCFAAIPLARGTRIADYEGESISWDEAMRRRRRGLGHCICDLEDGTCIDGRFGGNGTEYLNHSCTPNCGLLLAQGRLTIYALRNIAPGTELTVNYLSSLELVEIPCQCPTCLAKTNRR